MNKWIWRNEANFTHWGQVPKVLQHHISVQDFLSGGQQGPLLLWEVHWHFLEGDQVLKHHVYIQVQPRTISNSEPERWWVRLRGLGGKTQCAVSSDILQRSFIISSKFLELSTSVFTHWTISFRLMVFRSLSNTAELILPQLGYKESSNLIQDLVQIEHTTEGEKYLGNECFSWWKKVFMFLHGTQQNMELTLTLGDYLKHKTNIEAFP